jgi:hypothetical protein
MRADILRRCCTALSSPAMAVVAVTLASGCNSPNSPTRTPASPSILMHYHVSGIVTDDDDSPIANAGVSVETANGYKQATTSTNVKGFYEAVFETESADSVRLIHAGGGEYEQYFMQALPSSTADIVKNLRLRRVRTVNVGQQIVISIDRDSSLAYDGEDWLALDHAWERFHLRVADAGRLTIDARPVTGGVAASLGVRCVRITDNCSYTWIKLPLGTGTGSLFVQRNSIFEFTLAIPSRMAPQRYDVVTSLQP